MRPFEASATTRPRTSFGYFATALEAAVAYARAVAADEERGSEEGSQEEEEEVQGLVTDDHEWPPKAILKSVATCGTCSQYDVDLASAHAEAVDMGSGWGPVEVRLAETAICPTVMVIRLGRSQ